MATLSQFWRSTGVSKMLKIFEASQPSAAVWQGLDAWAGHAHTAEHDALVQTDASLLPEKQTASSQTLVQTPAVTTAGIVVEQNQSGSKLKTIALCGAGGGVGKTSLAINIAYELASAKHRTALVDFDILNPNLLAALNQDAITAGLAGAHRLVKQERFDASDLDRLMMVLNFDGVRLSILPGLGAPAARESIGEYIDTAKTIISQLASEFEYVVIDLPSAGEATDLIKTCLDVCDVSFAVCGAEPSAIQRYFWAKPQLQSGLGNDLQVIVNGVRDAVIGADAKRQIADTLDRIAGAEVVAFVPHDQTAFDQSLLQGLPLTLAKKASPARHAISMLVRQGLLGQRVKLDWRVARGG